MQRHGRIVPLHAPRRPIDSALARRSAHGSSLPRLQVMRVGSETTGSDSIGPEPGPAAPGPSRRWRCAPPSSTQVPALRPGSPCDSDTPQPGSGRAASESAARWHGSASESPARPEGERCGAEGPGQTGHGPPPGPAVRESPRLPGPLVAGDSDRPVMRPRRPGPLVAGDSDRPDASLSLTPRDSVDPHGTPPPPGAH